MILARVSPVTHSVGSSVKRVVVIVSSILFFRTPVSPINCIGKFPSLIKWGLDFGTMVGHESAWVKDCC